MTLVQKIIEVFSQYEGSPDDLVTECERWARTFAGHEEELRALMLKRRSARRWVPLEEVATALGVEVATEGEARSPLGPAMLQWCEAVSRWPCGPRESPLRTRQMQAAQANPPEEEQVRAWMQVLNAARVGDGHPPHRFVGPARYGVEQDWQQARQGMQKKSRYQLASDQERAFYARLRAADLEDAAAGWEVPLSPIAQAQAEEQADAGLPPAARRFVGR